MRNRLIVCSVLALFMCDWAFGQQPTAKSDDHKYRTIFTLAGGGGGFAAGLVVGLAAFDDATDSSRKVWTTAVLSAVGGAFGGYFLGRALDKRPKKTNVTWGPPQLERGVNPSQWSVRQANESQNSWPQAERQVLLIGSNPIIGSKGIHQTGRSPTPHRNVNYLYLVSALRRLERVSHLSVINGVHVSRGEDSSRR